MNTIEGSVKVEILKRARALIANPCNWVQGAYVVDRTGMSAPICSSRAVAFCSIGAVMRVTNKILKLDGSVGVDDENDAIDALDDAARYFGADSAPDLNDTSTHAEVLQMFDLAISNMESQL